MTDPSVPAGMPAPAPWGAHPESLLGQEEWRGEVPAAVFPARVSSVSVAVWLRVCPTDS